MNRKVPPTITISIFDGSCPKAINFLIFDVICNLGSNLFAIAFNDDGSFPV